MRTPRRPRPAFVLSVLLACSVAGGIAPGALASAPPAGRRASAGVFAHEAVAPMYLQFGGYEATIHLFNASSRAVTVEIAFDPTGFATSGPPTRHRLGPGRSRIIALSDLLTRADPEHDDRAIGVVRLRHDGETDDAVRARVLVEKDPWGEYSFSTPFLYATPPPAQHEGLQVQVAPSCTSGTAGAPTSPWRTPRIGTSPSS